MRLSPRSAASGRCISATGCKEAVEIGNPVWGELGERRRVDAGDAAQMIGAKPEEIALVNNTTGGISLVAEGLDWRDGDNVVTFADEFPSNVYPWMNLASRGVETRRVPADVSGRPDLEKLAAACDARTRIVTVSWVGFATGYRHDVRRIADIAHQKGALMFLDGIQGLGVFPIDVDDFGIDFLAADGHKWLLGPEGAGIAYIRRKHLDQASGDRAGLAQRQSGPGLYADRAEPAAGRRPVRGRFAKQRRHARPSARASDCSRTGARKRLGRRARHHRSRLRTTGQDRRNDRFRSLGPITAAASSARESSHSSCPAATRWP